ncbi:MAG: 2-C-methyl-D-erythritol 2,4-cyclodiphosphate synthase [Pyrinomonadaceae bacterium]|nr:2-C-methyl-D-erythritol 2,4-cyclodiphosphate synthase [Pyrinomonadaceae bacterium]
MYRVGFGNDIHELKEGRILVLGGVEVPSDVEAVGHSDADALLHAVTDSILGALALGDIGSHFSEKDKRWEGADSEIFLNETVKMMREKGFEVENIDSTISLEKPKLREQIESMRSNLSRLLGVNIDQVSIKAKTGEGFDAVGTRQAIKAEACILLKKV